jgi:hypothetical protein
MIRTLVLSAATMALFCQSDPAAAADYFPLPQDGRWTYDVIVTRPHEDPLKLTAVRSIDGTKKVGDRQYIRMVTNVTGGAIPMPDQLYRIAADGVYAAVEGTDGKELLVLPTNPAAKSSWNGDAPPTIGQLTAVAKTNETVTVGTATFENCIKVSLDMIVVQKSFFSETKTPVRMERWFAPGSGLVRELRAIGEEGKDGFIKIDSRLTHYGADKRP